MRSDIGHFYDAPIEDVFLAYKQAIKEKFKKDADSTPYHTLVFGLNFSFKYNMNGGGCHVHFMPSGNGTSVAIRYTIAQAVGANYKAHNRDMTSAVQSILGISAQELDIDMDSFMQQKESYIASCRTQAYAEPAPIPQNTQINTTQAPQKALFCYKCGSAFNEDDVFCTRCGTKRI